ncbi:hypothetical protein WMF04_23815 [Sorangium sp. So ce260]|uniref:hypothetical protein n=1 Tax=Sorangium sp. So ce260 TaxID=3133291 RepID=UPI003F5D804B
MERGSGRAGVAASSVQRVGPPAAPAHGPSPISVLHAESNSTTTIDDVRRMVVWTR